MGELINKIFAFFENNAVSMSKKMVMLVLTVILVLFVDNCCGFSYYFVQSYKLDYITNLENARLKYSGDKVVSEELDKMMVNTLNRWTIYNAVSDIFQKTFSTTSEAREKKLTEEIIKNKKESSKKEIGIANEPNDIFSKLFPIAERSPFWHTVCSSFNLIIVLLICILYMICYPFIKDANKKNGLLGMCVVIPFLIGAIFFTQWIVSFIPDIADRPRINNVLYILANIIIIVLMIKMKK